jgi:hypothetical protein
MVYQQIKKTNTMTTKYNYEVFLEDYISHGTYKKGDMLKLTKKAYELGLFTDIKKAIIEDKLTGMTLTFKAKKLTGANLDPKSIVPDLMVCRALTDNTIHSMIYELKELLNCTRKRNPLRYLVKIELPCLK